MSSEESNSEAKLDKTMNTMFENKTLSVCHGYLFSIPMQETQ